MRRDEDMIEKIEDHVNAIMDILELDRNKSNEGTPKRIGKMLVTELFQNRNNQNIEELDSKMKVFPAESKDLVKIEVPLMTVCDHHWLPFVGDVTVTYIPRENIIGLSKIPRVVKYFSKKPQLQELITTEIKDYLVKHIQPEYLRVDIKATHMCVEMRGVESPCITYTTSEYSYGDEIDD